MRHHCRCKTYGKCGNVVEKDGDKCEYCANGHEHKKEDE